MVSPNNHFIPMERIAHELGLPVEEALKFVPEERLNRWESDALFALEDCQHTFEQAQANLKLAQRRCALLDAEQKRREQEIISDPLGLGETPSHQQKE